MARIENSQSLSIVIPSLNEADNLPLLLADLRLWTDSLEICICDGGSSDLTIFTAELAGANSIHSPEPNRGCQLHYGACETKGDWLLFLHADCRMPKYWHKVIKDKINKASSRNIVWHFDFKVQSKKIEFRLMEYLVAIRSYILKRPYGDQGLLINRNLYQSIGGYKSLYVMEDLDFIERITKKYRVKSLGLPLYSNDRRWRRINVFKKAWKNAQLRKRWRRGEGTKDLLISYYNDKE